MERYAEMVAGTARKFYKVETSGVSWTASWGRIGTAGQSKTTQCYSERAAEREAEEQFRSKLKKGYVERSALESLAKVMDYDKEVPTLIDPIALGVPSSALHVAQTAAAKLNRIAADRREAGRRVLEDQAKSVLESLAHALGKLGVGYSERARITHAMAAKLRMGPGIYVQDVSVA